MKILYIVPKNLKTVPMVSYAKEALEDLGHNVLIDTYNESLIEKIFSKIFRVIKEEIYFAVNMRIRRKIINFKPDLLFTIYGIHISRETLAFANSLNVKTACWWLNDPFQFERGFKLSSNYNYWFSNSRECANIVSKKLKIKAHFLPAACNPEIHKKTPKNSKFSCDLCFAGDWSLSRENLLLYLVAKGIDIKIYGPWEKKINKKSPLYKYLVPGFFSPSQMADYFSNAKIVLNLHTWFKKSSHGVNPRIFESAACDTVQIVDFKKEIPTLFKPGSELIAFKNINELPSLISKLLKNKPLRRKIAKAAKLRALKDHTYKQRMKEMLCYVAE